MAGSSYFARNSLSSSIIEYEYMWKLCRPPLSLGELPGELRLLHLVGAQDLPYLLRSPKHFALFPAFGSGQSVMIQRKMTSTPKPFFTRVIVQCMGRNYFLIPAGMHWCFETLMSFALAQVTANRTANRIGSSEHPLVFCIFGIWIIFPPGPTASYKCG